MNSSEIEAETGQEILVKSAIWEKDHAQLIQLRTLVFIEEQKVPAELELDGMDEKSLHVKALTGSGEVIGTSRLLPDHHIGRMCVLKKFRLRGAGSQMLAYFIQHARQNSFPRLMLNAQLSALPFYQKHGFVVDSNVFMEADIKHVHMTLTLAKSTHQ